MSRADKEIIKVVKPKEPDIYEVDLNVKDIDEEFEKIYSNVLIDIKIDFREYIKDICLPFLDKINGQSIFYDFMKYNSKNFETLCNDVYKFNENYFREVEEYEIEMEQNEAEYDNYYTKV